MVSIVACVCSKTECLTAKWCWSTICSAAHKPSIDKGLTEFGSYVCGCPISSNEQTTGQFWVRYFAEYNWLRTGVIPPYMCRRSFWTPNMKSSVSLRKHDSDDIRSSNPTEFIWVSPEQKIFSNMLSYTPEELSRSHTSHTSHTLGRIGASITVGWLLRPSKNRRVVHAWRFHGYPPYRFLFAECWYGPVISVLQKHLPPRARWVDIF